MSVTGDIMQSIEHARRTLGGELPTYVEISREEYDAVWRENGMTGISIFGFTTIYGVPVRIRA